MDPVEKYARGVEWQGWGGVLLVFAVAALVVWLIAILIQPEETLDMWPFAVFAAILAVVGYVMRRRGQRDEEEAEESGAPDVP